jgi:two-component system, NarL family, response regulator DesR
MGVARTSVGGPEAEDGTAVIDILLAEDHHVVRAALVALLALEPDLRVVAEVGRGDEVLDAVRRSSPQVAVLDIDMPGLDGIEAATAIGSQVNDCRVLILSALGRPGTLRRALAAGVGGFLSKDTSPTDLVAAIRAVHDGRRVLDPDLAALAWEPESRTVLTPRELEVLSCLADGDDADEIAATLFLSSGTVRNYLTQIVWKLGARNRTDAVRIAREAGWL